MEKTVLHWQLNEQPENTGTERYCHNCGHTVLFQDTGKRRHNANGKNIYEYAIFKCENGHTWNQILTIQKSGDAIQNMNVEIGQELNLYANDSLDRIDIAEWKKNGIHTAEITLDKVSGKWRLDKLLSQQIKDLSRMQLEKLIKDGTIRLDGKTVKPGSLLKPQQVITISLSEKE
jgi:hypothetical protein